MDTAATMLIETSPNRQRSCWLSAGWRMRHSGVSRPGARHTLRLRDVTRSVSEGVRTAAINCCACRREVTRSVSEGVRTTNLQYFWRQFRFPKRTSRHPWPP